MGRISKADFLRKPKLETLTLSSGATMCVREITAGEHEQFVAAVTEAGKDSSKLAAARLLLVALSLCDEQGGRLFADAEVAMLREAANADVEEVFEAAQRISGMGRGLDEAKKNSEKTQ